MKKELLEISKEHSLNLNTNTSISNFLSSLFIFCCYCFILINSKTGFTPKLYTQSYLTIKIEMTSVKKIFQVACCGGITKSKELAQKQAMSQHKIPMGDFFMFQVDIVFLLVSPFSISQIYRCYHTKILKARFRTTVSHELSKISLQNYESKIF